MHQSINKTIESLSDVNEINYLINKIAGKKMMYAHKLASICETLNAIDKRQKDHKEALMIAQAEYVSADTMYAFHTDIFKKKEMEIKKLRLEVKIENINAKLAKFDALAYIRLEFDGLKVEGKIEFCDQWLSALEKRKTDVEFKILN